MLIWSIILGTLLAWAIGYFGGVRFIKGQALIDVDAKALSDMGSITENSIRDALRRHPKSIHPVLAWVDLAVAANDWPEAIRRAELFMAMFPKRAESAATFGRVLALSGRVEESDAFFKSKMKKFGSHPALHIEYTENARRLGDLNEAALRIRPALQKSPDSINAYLIAVAISLGKGEFDAAEALLQEGENACGGKPGAFGPVPRAEIASYRKDWRQAAELWTEARMGQPGHVTCYLRGSEALRESGELEAASDLLAMGLPRFPENPQIRDEYELVSTLLANRNEPASGTIQ